MQFDSLSASYLYFLSRCALPFSRIQPRLIVIYLECLVTLHRGFLATAAQHVPHTPYIQSNVPHMFMFRIHHTYNLRLCASYIPFPCCRTPVVSALRLLHCCRAVGVAHRKIEEGQQFQANFLVQTPRISSPAHWQFLWPSACET